MRDSTKPNIIYISPSIIPSRSANSIHVINQANAFANLGHKTFLFCASEHITLSKNHIEDFYGIKINDNLSFIVCSKDHKSGLNMRIGIFSIYYLIRKKILCKPFKILSRNLYFSFLFSFSKYSHIYETHGPEKGFRFFMQKLILSKEANHIIVISSALKNILSNIFNVSKSKFVVLHDAANEYIKSGHTKLKYNGKNLIKVGYFGHLYEGRGIEIVIGLSNVFKNIDFYIVGGEPEMVKKLKEQNCKMDNVFILGHQKNSYARHLMNEMDVLLMPYQNKVSIGTKDSDTSKWMSPLKMFEYMSSNSAIISSELDVIKEVLKNKYNALLAAPNSLDDWEESLNLLINDDALRKDLSKNAYKDFKDKYTWHSRANNILSIN